MQGELIKPLHGLRGMAALTVVVGHFGFPGSASLGVVLFFVLSGYLMGRLYLPANMTPEVAWRYIINRFARVYPLFAFVVIGAALLNIAIPEANVFGLKPSQVDDHLLLFGSNRTIWTICVEFQFYGLFILFWWATSRLGHPRLLATGTIAVGLVWATHTYHPANSIDIFGYIHVFAIGILIALLGDAIAKLNSRWAHAALLGFLALYCLVYVAGAHFSIHREIYINPMALIACGGIVLASMAAGDCWANRMLSLKPAVWLGEISFGMYLFHRPLQVLMNEIYLTDIPSIIELPLRFAVLFLVSHLALITLEKPCRSALRTIGERLIESRTKEQHE